MDHWRFLSFSLCTIDCGAIEQYAFGIGRESENTQTILSIMDAVPWLVIVIALIGPILEEIIFRKIIFGVIYEKRISSLEHLPVQWFSLLYTMISPYLALYRNGLYLCLLYAKTKRIIVPIGAHMLMNSLVVLVQIEPVKND